MRPRCACCAAWASSRKADLEALKASLEHQIPKLKGGDFVDLLSALAEDHCWESRSRLSLLSVAQKLPHRAR